jgi:hypothetical protein
MRATSPVGGGRLGPPLAARRDESNAKVLLLRHPCGFGSHGCSVPAATSRCGCSRQLVWQGMVGWRPSILVVMEACASIAVGALGSCGGSVAMGGRRI